MHLWADPSGRPYIIVRRHWADPPDAPTVSPVNGRVTMTSRTPSGKPAGSGQRLIKRAA